MFTALSFALAAEPQFVVVNKTAPAFTVVAAGLTDLAPWSISGMQARLPVGSGDSAIGCRRGKDGGVTVDDLLFFLAKFEQGC